MEIITIVGDCTSFLERDEKPYVGLFSLET